MNRRQVVAAAPTASSSTRRRHSARHEPSGLRPAGKKVRRQAASPIVAAGTPGEVSPLSPLASPQGAAPALASLAGPDLVHFWASSLPPQPITETDEDGRLFQPLSTSRRFRIIDIDLLPRSLKLEGPEARLEALAALPAPGHFLDVPTKFEALLSDFWHDPAELVSKRAGLAEVERLNRRAERARQRREDFKPGWPWSEWKACEWFVLVELGQPEPMAVSSLTLDEHGAGQESREANYPLRLVRGS